MGSHKQCSCPRGCSGDCIRPIPAAIPGDGNSCGGCCRSGCGNEAEGLAEMADGAPERGHKQGCSGDDIHLISTTALDDCNSPPCSRDRCGGHCRSECGNGAELAEKPDIWVPKEGDKECCSVEGNLCSCDGLCPGLFYCHLTILLGLGLISPLVQIIAC